MANGADKITFDSDAPWELDPLQRCNALPRITVHSFSTSTEQLGSHAGSAVRPRFFVDELRRWAVLHQASPMITSLQQLLLHGMSGNSCFPLHEQQLTISWMLMRCRTSKMAMPLFFQNLLAYSTSIVAVSFIGHLNDASLLSSAVLANSLYTVTGYSVVQGLSAGDGCCLPGTKLGMHTGYVYSTSLQR